MIHSILKDAPHLAISACKREENDFTTITNVLASLIAERVPVDLDKLYGTRSYAPDMIEPVENNADPIIKVPVGGKMPALEFGLRRAQPSRSGNAASGPEGPTPRRECGNSDWSGSDESVAIVSSDSAMARSSSRVCRLKASA